MTVLTTQHEIRAQAALECAQAFVDAARTRLLHGRQSTHVARALAGFVASLDRCRHEGVEAPFSLQFADDAMHHEGKPLVAPSLQAKALLRAAAARDVAAITFADGFDADECNRLFDLLLEDCNRDSLHRQHREAALAAFGVRHARVSSRTPADPENRALSLPDADRQDLRHYQDLADALHDNAALAAGNRVLGVAGAQGLIEQTVLRLDQAPSGLLSLATQDNVDRFTVGHSVRVALLALQVARAAGALKQQLIDVGVAALLHDIGKSKVPPEILYKRGKLDEQEWVWMAQHPRLGADILLEQDVVLPSAVGAAFCHHMDGHDGGYPSPLLPLKPSGTSRLIRVCDVFEALTSMRPYKRALTPMEAYAVMRRHAHDFDPRWLSTFVRTLGVFPQGSRVRLDDGSLAVVLRQGAMPSTPIVRPLTGPGGADLTADAPDEVAIGATLRGETRTVCSVYTRDRSVPVPEEGYAPLDYLTQTVHGACLRRGPHGSPSESARRQRTSHDCPW